MKRTLRPAGAVRNRASSRSCRRNPRFPILVSAFLTPMTTSIPLWGLSSEELLAPAPPVDAQTSDENRDTTVEESAGLPSPPRDGIRAPVVAGIDLDAELRRFYLANGLLNRGLFDLAAEEYRAFLTEHPGHVQEPLARYGLAVCHFKRSDFDSASKELKTLLRNPNAPQTVEAAVMLGQCLLTQGDPRAAAEVLDHALKASESQPVAPSPETGIAVVLLAAEAHYRTGEYGTALNRAATLLERFPRSDLRPRAEFLQGLSLLAQGNFAQARDRFLDVQQSFPSSPLAHEAEFHLAQCAQKLGESAEAEQHYRNVLRRPEGSLFPDALLGLAFVLHESGRHAEAEQAAGTLIDQNPDDERAVTAWRLRMETAFAEGRHQRVIELAGELERRRPKLGDEAAYWSAKALLKLGDDEAAWRVLADALDHYPESSLRADLLIDSAMASTRLGDDDRALTLLETFERNHSGHPLASTACHLLAAVHHRLGHFDESRRWVACAVTTESDSGDRADVAFLSAENEYRTGRFDHAVASLEQFLDQFPQDPRAVVVRARLALSHYHAGRPDQAEPMLTSAASSEITGSLRTRVRFALGDLLFRSGRWSEAAVRLEPLAHDPDAESIGDDVLLRLGVARERLGDAPAARRTLEELTSKFPNTPHLAHARFELGQCHLLEGNLEEAARHFEQILVMESAGAFREHTLRHLASIDARRGDHQGAAQRLSLLAQSATGEERQALEVSRGRAMLSAGEFGEAERLLVELCTTEGGERSVEACGLRALAVAQQDRCQEFLSLIGSGLEFKSGQLDPQLKPALDFERARCLTKTGKSADAARVYQDFMAERPDGLQVRQAILNLASLHMQDRRFSEALTLLSDLDRRIVESADAGGTSRIVGPEEDGIGSDRDAAALRAQLDLRVGICSRELGQYEQAVDRLERFLKGADGDGADLIAANVALADSLTNLGRHEPAIKLWTRIIDQSSDTELKDAALIRLGECLGQSTRWSESEEAFTRHRQAFPQSTRWPEAAFGIAWAREHSGRPREAIPVYHEVVTSGQQPLAARAQFQIGECLFGLKQYEDATRALLEVDILHAHGEWSPAALYEAGRCLETMGRHDDAKSQFKAVVDRFGESNWARLARERLSEGAAGSASSAGVSAGGSR